MKNLGPRLRGNDERLSPSYVKLNNPLKQPYVIMDGIRRGLINDSLQANEP